MMMFPLIASRLILPVTRSSGSRGRDDIAEGELMERSGRPSALYIQYVLVLSHAQVFDSVDEGVAMEEKKRKPVQTPSDLVSATDKTYQLMRSAGTMRSLVAAV